MSVKARLGNVLRAEGVAHWTVMLVEALFAIHVDEVLQGNALPVGRSKRYSLTNQARKQRGVMLQNTNTVVICADKLH